MKLNKEAIKSVLNYIIEKQKFNFEDWTIDPLYFSGIVKDLSNGDPNKKQEIAFALIRCINENLVKSNHPDHTDWSSAAVSDVTFSGFEWLGNN